MNKVELIGRLTKDPETRYTDTQDPMAISRFTLAVDRRKKEKDADFIQCKAFGKSAEFVEKYFHKGMKVAVVGRIQTGSYDHKDGYKVYTTDVICEELDFCERKQENSQPEPAPDDMGFINIPDNIDEELPFN